MNVPIALRDDMATEFVALLNAGLGAAGELHILDGTLPDDTEDADGQPAAGDVCGPTRRLWIATTSGSGFRAAGDPNNRVVPVTQQGTSRFQGKLTEDLLAAVNTKRDPSTGKARILFRKLDGDLTLSTKEVTIVNRFENISVDSGIQVRSGLHLVAVVDRVLGHRDCLAPQRSPNRVVTVDNSTGHFSCSQGTHRIILICVLSLPQQLRGCEA